MKKLLYSICFGTILLTGSSCFKTDDYPAPGETLTGTLTDSITGMPLQTEQGNGVRIKLDELSWSDNPLPLYFWARQDGSFNNTKLFAGTYRITPVDGPFVPLIQVDSKGDTIVNHSQTTEIKGNTRVNFTVTPFLEVKWMDEPVLNPDSTITVHIQFLRGTSDPAFQFNVTDAYLFVCDVPYVGSNNFDSRYSTQVSYSGQAGNALIGQTITIKTKPLPSHGTYYIRAGARTSDNVQKRYNYTDIKTVPVP